MNEETIDPTYYRSIVGKLIQLCHSQSNISYFVGIITYFIMKPQIPHFKTSKRILRYIIETLNYRKDLTQ